MPAEYVYRFLVLLLNWCLENRHVSLLSYEDVKIRRKVHRIDLSCTTQHPISFYFCYFRLRVLKMIRKSTLFRVFHRPSRPIRILAFSSFFFTALWTVLTISPLLCPRQADLETDYPLIHRHIYSCNSTGGGKCPIHDNAIGEPHCPNQRNKHGIFPHLGLMGMTDNLRIFSMLLAKFLKVLCPGRRDGCLSQISH
jgi:hypothetical protein